MHFNETQQRAFDVLIGEAAACMQNGRFNDAHAKLSEAEHLLAAHKVTDVYDWSGLLDLRMSIDHRKGDLPGAARTAKRMLDTIDPEPPEFNEAQQSIIQDSLVEAALVRAEYLQTQADAESQLELQTLAEAGVRWCVKLGRDGNQRDFEAMLSLGTRAAGANA